jgi:acyl-coenzyme A synthetase/AMP-(fatty) acid ligase/acyl carrier protein
MIGGEPFPLSLLLALQEKTTAKIYNMYGHAETTIWSAVSDLTNEIRIDIGHSIKNASVYIVEENLFILPNEQAGEICIAGRGLAKGYFGRLDLTAERFVCLPQKSETKIYRTGDIGRYLKNGRLEYLGRIDNLVNVQGYRIGLEEIESHLNQFMGIIQSVVIALETSETDKVLQAFYTSADKIDSKDISDYLSTQLPSYMIPVSYKRVKEFHLTANGKIDRKRISECVEVRFGNDVISSAFDDLSPNHNKAFQIIASNLGENLSHSLSIDMELSSIGLDSITFIKTIVALESEFDFEFDDEMLLITKFSTIKSMIEYVESKAFSTGFAIKP